MATTGSGRHGRPGPPRGAVPAGAGTWRPGRGRHWPSSSGRSCRRAGRRRRPRRGTGRAARRGRRAPARPGRRRLGPPGPVRAGAGVLPDPGRGVAAHGAGQGRAGLQRGRGAAARGGRERTPGVRVGLDAGLLRGRAAQPGHGSAALDPAVRGSGHRPGRRGRGRPLAGLGPDLLAVQPGPLHHVRLRLDHGDAAAHRPFHRRARRGALGEPLARARGQRALRGLGAGLRRRRAGRDPAGRPGHRAGHHDPAGPRAAAAVRRRTWSSGRSRTRPAPRPRCAPTA